MLRITFALFLFFINSITAFAQTGQMLPIPKVEDEPWNVAYISTVSDDPIYTRLSANRNEAFSLTRLDSLHAAVDPQANLSWNALIIDGVAVASASEETLEWIASAYWKQGLVLVGINMDRPTLRRLVGSCAAAEDKPVWWEDGGDYFFLTSRMVHAVKDADRENKILELTQCEDTDFQYENYLTESNFAAAYFLNSDAEVEYLYANLDFALEDVLRSRMEFGRYLSLGQNN